MMKSILDRNFTYRNAASTDVAQTFARERERLQRDGVEIRYLRVAADALNKAADILKESNDETDRAA